MDKNGSFLREHEGKKSTRCLTYPLSVDFHLSDLLFTADHPQFRHHHHHHHHQSAKVRQVNQIIYCSAVGSH
ncbi:hypothetical protein L6452_21123 [Arctium lappa]|uniref:Uncharacterized protein n=1 Tax=Arctium lappa TaxID=4217 RepID=A0ACB9BE29_ARCLA|nr:hypothetical protein L6452_21123 [Arctium lappa]